jgi:hypothetical protein
VLEWRTNTTEVAGWLVNNTKEPQAYKGGLGMRTSRHGCTLMLKSAAGKTWSADAPPRPELQHYKDIVVPPGEKVLIGRWDLAALRYSEGNLVRGAGQLAFADLPLPAKYQVQWWDGVFQLGNPLRSAPIEIVVGAQETTTSVVRLIVALASANQEERAKAADDLRLVLGRDPSAAPNRHERAFWEARLAKISPGMSQDAVIKLLYPNHAWTIPSYKEMRGAWSGQSGTATYRLDDYWTATIYFIKPESPEVSLAPVLNEEVRSVWIAPPKDFTGLWTTYFVNGQKAYEGRYEHGKQVGTWRWWDEAGKLTSEKTFAEPTP